MKLLPEGKQWRHAGIPVVILTLLVLSSSTRYASPAAASSPPSMPNLATAAIFGVLAGSAVTNTGDSVVFGNLGVSPGTAVIGFPPGSLTGAIHKNDAVAVQAKTDLASAYNAISGDSCSSNLSGQNLGGLTLTPGVYCFSSAALLTGTLTLNSQGSNNAVFIFKIGSALVTASSSSVVMTAGGGDSFCNVFWQIGSSAVLGTNTTFDGNILALASITLGTGTSIAGGALARNGAVTLDTNHVGACPAQPIWTQEMQHTPTPGQGGCFDGTFPNTAWNEVRCASDETIPIPEWVGDGWGDYAANAGSLTDISFTKGSFSSVSSVTSENDTGDSGECSPTPCPGYYALQVNSQVFSCTYSGSPATCWQQFVFRNSAASGNSGRVYMQYWLLNGYGGTTYGSPNSPTSNPGTWNPFWDIWHSNYDCFINSSQNSVPNESVTTQLGSLSLSGQSNIQSSGDDIVALCNGGTCYQVSASDSVFALYNHWQQSEFGIYGYGGQSEAVFNTGTTIKPAVQEQDANAGIITPTCDSIGGYTAEFNNLSLVSGSCSVSGYYEIMGFTESD